MVDNVLGSNNENIMTDVLPSLDEYLNADSALLPDLTSRRKKEPVEMKDRQEKHQSAQDQQNGQEQSMFYLI